MTKTLATALTVTLTLILVIAGCGSDNNDSAPTTTQTTTAATNPTAALKRGVRAALNENRRLSIYVLWNNKIPAWATQSTRGPALAGLRTAAADRKRRGIRVKLLSDRFQIRSITLNPSYTEATAVVQGRQRVQPSRANGQPSGRAVTLNERARVQLRRLGNTDRFVVWKVTLVS